MNRKMSRQELKRAVERSVIRDEERKRINWSATTSIKEVLMVLDSSLKGLDDLQIRRNRMIYGKNRMAEDKNMIYRILDYFNQPSCEVVRKQETPVSISSRDLVVGDIVYLSKGDVAPADLRVIESANLTVDQKLITGVESAVKKKAGISLCELDKVTDYFNIILRGTSVIEGSGEAVVLSVGKRTILGTME